jgi:ABC-2 type transport system ATP-binding protein
MISIRHIVKQYSGYRALSDVSLEVEQGTVFGLLGPNGAGKTSLIRIINQITAPDSGEILFNGEPLSRIHTERIGYMPEERGLYKKMESYTGVVEQKHRRTIEGYAAESPVCGYSAAPARVADTG